MTGREPNQDPTYCEHDWHPSGLTTLTCRKCGATVNMPPPSRKDP